MRMGFCFAVLSLITIVMGVGAYADGPQLRCKIDFQEWGEVGFSTFYTEATQSVPVLWGTASLYYEGAFATAKAEMTPDGMFLSFMPSAGIKITDESRCGETAEGIHCLRYDVEDLNGVFRANKLGSILLSCWAD